MRCTLQLRLRKELNIFLLGTSSTSTTPKQKHSSPVSFIARVIEADGWMPPILCSPEELRGNDYEE